MANRKPSRREPRATARTGRRFSLTAGWAAAVLALLVVLFFHEVTVGGNTFVSPDATAPAGFVRVGEHSLYHDHVYPLWNPYVFLGMPSFASGAYNPLIYPPDWPLALLQKVLPLPDLTWLLLYYFLGGLALFLLAREWGARPEGALLGAAAFVFGPNLVAIGSHGHGSQLVDSAYAPLMLWLATRWLRRGRLADLGWLALAGGFQLLRGHVQVCFYTWLAVALYVVVELVAALRRPGDLRRVALRAAGVAAAAVVAFGLSAFYSLPLHDYARHSIRGGGADGGVGMAYATQWSLSPIELPSIVVPGWNGFGDPTYWGGMPFTNYPNAYLGVIAVALALPAFLSNGAPRVFALVLAAFSLLVAFGKYFPLYGLLYDHLPLFNKFRIPVMIVLLFQIAAALGLAWGWSAVLERDTAGKARGKPVGKVLLAAAIALALALVIGVMGQDAWRGAYVALAERTRAAALGVAPSRSPYSAQLAAAAWHGFVSDLARTCLLGLLALGAAFLAHRGRLRAGLASVVVLALLMGELWPVSGRVMQPVVGPVTAKDVDAGRDDVVRFLEQAGPPGSFRVLPNEEFQSNRFAGFGIASVGGYHAAKTRLFQDFYERVLTARGFSLPWLSLLNVRYLIVSRPFDNPPPFLREVFRGSSTVYELTSALPRATVVGEYSVVRPAGAILDSISGGQVDVARRTLLTEDPHLALGPVEGATDSITHYGLQRVEVEVSTPGPALLRLADLYYPYWTATVDGRPAPVLRADYLLRAVPVPAGRHRVVFAYRSPVVRRGLEISLASLVLVLLLIAVGWWRGRAPARGGPVPDEAATEERTG